MNSTENTTKFDRTKSPNALHLHRAHLRDIAHRAREAAPHVINDNVAACWTGDPPLTAFLGYETFNALELNAVRCLLAWIEHTQDVAHRIAEHILEAEFGVNDIRRLNRDDFDDVVEFLVNLDVEGRA